MSKICTRCSKTHYTGKKKTKKTYIPSRCWCQPNRSVQCERLLSNKSSLRGVPPQLATQHSAAQHISLPTRVNPNTWCRLSNLMTHKDLLYRSNTNFMTDSLATSHHSSLTKPFTSDLHTISSPTSSPAPPPTRTLIHFRGAATCDEYELRQAQSCA